MQLLSACLSLPLQQECPPSFKEEQMTAKDNTIYYSCVPCNGERRLSASLADMFMDIFLLMIN